MRPTEHLDTLTLYELLDGRLDVADVRRAEAHLLRCDSCRALREECTALLSAVRWYGADPPRPPTGYWSSFWQRWPVSSDEVSIPRPARRRVSELLALAAAIALLIGIVGDVDDPRVAPIANEPTTLVDDAEWVEEYEYFEQVTIAVGSVDPLSKGVVLASLAERP